MKSKFKIFITSLLIVTVFLVIGLLITFYSILNMSLPETSGEITFDNLKENVEITYDAMGIPQIWAKTEADGFFSLGYLHASDRLFQMELIRRASNGRLSELLGERTLPYDQRQRLMGHSRMANLAIEKLLDNDRKRLQAYVDGINSFASECDAFPIEFYLLQISFEDWTIHDCLTIQSFQTWFSDALMNRDLFYIKAIEKVGLEKAKKLDHKYPDWAPATIDNKKYSSTNIPSDHQTISESSLPTQLSESVSSNFKEAIADQLFSNSSSPFSMSTSSNAWAVAPDKSISGKAMLASDPHLDISRLPQFWYYAGLHIEASQTDVVGITTAGLPFFVMGHNGKIAYAFTAGGVDITDYYLETINPEDSNQYATENGWQNFTKLTDSIFIAGEAKPFYFDMNFTRHGPIISELDTLEETYSVRWAGFDVDLERSVSAGFDLHNAYGFESFRELVTNFGALNANWIYADSADNIGYQLGTPIPIRQNVSGKFPLNGSKGKQEWLGFYPLDMTPHKMNPKKNWLGNCNNLSQRDGIPYYVYGDYFSDRILRLNELMNNDDKLSVENFQSFQMDLTDNYLLRWRDEVVELFNKIGDKAHAQRLSDWDGNTSKQSRETLFMITFLGQLNKLIFEDDLGDLSSKVRKIWMDQWYHSDDTTFVDINSTMDILESKKTIALMALQKSLEILDPHKTMTTNPKDYSHLNWGAWHSLTIQHPLASVPIINSLLDLKFGPWPWQGTSGSLNASFFIEADSNKYTSFVGPSYRFVIDFADVNQATIVLPAGNSGNPYSEHFFDFNEMWQNGERWNVPIKYNLVKEKSVSSLFLLAR